VYRLDNGVHHAKTLFCIIAQQFRSSRILGKTNFPLRGQNEQNWVSHRRTGHGETGETTSSKISGAIARCANGAGRLPSKRVRRLCRCRELVSWLCDVWEGQNDGRTAGWLSGRAAACIIIAGQNRATHTVSGNHVSSSVGSRAIKPRTLCR
jgi:hypothetical protein